MRIDNTFRYTICKRPEWLAWLRQLEIDRSFNALQSIAQGEIPKGYVNYMKLYMEKQRQIHNQLLSL